MAIAVLETPRLLLRPFEPADRDGLTALCAEESFWWFPFRRAMTAAEAERFMVRQIDQYAGAEPGLHAVVERSTAVLVGCAGLGVPHFLPEVLPAIEVGWRLGEAFRGRGYATEAGAAALRWGFEGLGLDEILSIFEPANTPSGRVMDRLGFDAGSPKVHPRLGMPIVVRRLTADAWRGWLSAGR